MSNTTLCGLCTHPDDGHLCRHCTLTLREHLDALPGLYADLEDHLAPRATTSTGRTVPGSALPVAEPVLTLRGPGGIVGVLEDWLTAVHDARHLTPPLRQGSIEDRIDTAASRLVRQLPWIALSWPQAADLADEIRGLVRDIVRITDPPSEPPSTPLGPCQAITASGICGSPLRLSSGDKAAACSWCGSTWPPATWIDLRAWQQAAAEQPAAA
ncbi:hypothetical protein [Streptomyces tsukubensis]|uniref:hypothetical protein n=1 Tax=Streptomyces tsukubensis TaxID=83656 RepID=UPI003450E323